MAHSKLSVALMELLGDENPQTLNEIPSFVQGRNAGENFHSHLKKLNKNGAKLGDLFKVDIAPAFSDLLTEIYGPATDGSQQVKMHSGHKEFSVLEIYADRMRRRMLAILDIWDKSPEQMITPNEQYRKQMPKYIRAFRERYADAIPAGESPFVVLQLLVAMHMVLIVGVEQFMRDREMGLSVVYRCLGHKRLFQEMVGELARTFIAQGLGKEADDLYRKYRDNETVLVDFYSVFGRYVLEEQRSKHVPENMIKDQKELALDKEQAIPMGEISRSLHDSVRDAFSKRTRKEKRPFHEGYSSIAHLLVCLRVIQEVIRNKCYDADGQLIMPEDGEENVLSELTLRPTFPAVFMDTVQRDVIRPISGKNIKYNSETQRLALSQKRYLITGVLELIGTTVKANAQELKQQSGWSKTNTGEDTGYDVASILLLQVIVMMGYDMSNGQLFNTLNNINTNPATPYS